MPTNVVLDDDVKQDLAQLVESGTRSRIVNHALRRELQDIRRHRADARLESLRRSGKAVSTSEIVSALRKDRGR
jgi:Arc/MetJ family transcription regulator